MTTRITPSAAWIIGRLVAGQPVNGELDALDGPLRRIASHLASLPPEARMAAWPIIQATYPDGDALTLAVARVDPTDPMPKTEEADTGHDYATLADIARTAESQRWLWRGWLAGGVLNSLASEPGTGKTRFALDLARRLWFKLPWPDGQANELPEKTRTLWVQGDRNFAELLAAARDFGLPDDAVVLNATSDDPTGGLDLDDPATLSALAARTVASGAALVVIDTTLMTTGRNLCRPEDAREYFGPLMDLANKTGVPFLAQTHLSANGEALGRRIVEKVRVLMKMTCPDPEGQPNRRRLWVHKAAVVKPPPLGITMGDKGNDYDFAPPSEPEAPARGGRPPEAIARAVTFVEEKLSAGDRKWCELVDEWEAAGGSRGTIFNARRAMLEDGRLQIDATRKPQMAHLDLGTDPAPG